MRERLAALAAFGLAVVLGPGAWAQDAKTSSGDRNQSDAQVIRGVVAGVTAEGELAIDYRTNKAVLVQAAAITVVGSPASGQGGESTASSGREGRERQDQDRARGNSAGKARDNIYVVWINPRTKVYRTSDDSGGSRRKEEATLDQLEVGDRVELRLNRREESGANAGTHQTEQMRSKHGRDRTVFGDAVEITILPPRNDAQSSSDSRDSSKDDAGKANRDR